MLSLSLSWMPIIFAATSIVLVITALFADRSWLIMPWADMQIKRQLHRMRKQGACILENIHLHSRQYADVDIEYLVIGPEILALNRANYSGHILGSIRDAFWNHGNKHTTQRFENPLRQHERITNAIKHIIGARVVVKNYTIFTCGKLHIDNHDSIVSLKKFGASLPHWEDKKYNQGRQQQIAQLIANVSQTGDNSDSQAATSNEQLAVHKLLTGSVVCMLLAVVIVVFGYFHNI